MSDIQNRAAGRTPPRTDSNMRDAISVSGSAGTFAIPSTWKGNYVSFRCIGGTAFIRFGGATAGTGMAAQANGATGGWPVPDGSTDEFLIPDDVVGMGHIGSGSLSLAWAVTSGKVGR